MENYSCVAYVKICLLEWKYALRAVRHDSGVIRWILDRGSAIAKNGQISGVDIIRVLDIGTSTDPYTRQVRSGKIGGW